MSRIRGLEVRMMAGEVVPTRWTRGRRAAWFIFQREEPTPHRRCRHAQVILHDSDRDSRRRIGGAGERNEIDRNEKCRAIGHTRIRIEAAQRAVYRSTIPAMLLCMYEFATQKSCI